MGAASWTPKNLDCHRHNSVLAAGTATTRYSSRQPVSRVGCPPLSRDSSPYHRAGRNTMRTLALVTLLVACPAIAVTQQSSSQSRAQQVAAAFTKQKHLVAEKHG